MVLATVAVVDGVGHRSVDISGTALSPQGRHHKEPLQQQQTYLLALHSPGDNSDNYAYLVREGFVLMMLLFLEGAEDSTNPPVLREDACFV